MFAKNKNGVGMSLPSKQFRLGLVLVVLGFAFSGLSLWFMLTGGHLPGGPRAQGAGLVIGLTMIVIGVMVLCAL